MKKVLLVLVASFLIAGLSFAQEDGKEKKVIETKATKVESTRGANPNIVTARPAVDNPAPKPDESTRGDYCIVYVDNYSGYAIDIYVDGDYAGTVGAYGEGYTWAISGETKLYGLSTGGTVEWGPQYVDCNTEYTMTLNGF